MLFNKNHNVRLIVWTIVAALILLILVAMQFSDEVQWNETFAYCIILLAIGGAYELREWLKTQNRAYRYAFGFGLAGLILVGWANGAVGIIGSENNPANLMYAAVFVAGLFGSLLSRFKPSGLARTFFAVALVQVLVPVFALFVWPAQASWGEAGVIGVLIFNSIFALPFILSALLFGRAAEIDNPAKN